MNKSAFLELIQQASAISDQQTEELEKVAATFPYCQTAHLLLAKSAHDKGSMLSTQRLRRASAYATNRQVLKRLIYTSPAPAPVYEETVVAEEPALALSGDMTVETTLSPESPPGDAAFTAVPEGVYEEGIYKEETPEEPSLEASATESEIAAPEQDIFLQEDNHRSGEALAEASAGDVQEPEDNSYFELASLLTINSLSPSFTDLLTQKASFERPDTIASKVEEEDSTLIPAYDAVDEVSHLSEQIEAGTVSEIYISGPITKDRSERAEDTAHVAPEAAPINYSFSEIDQMYVDDALGYWMASSRMGETLQLKDEVTRQRPVAFHPELILEYTKTHVLEEKPREQQATLLHHQYSIIDQFLKLNPRLSSMQHVKMKQEPQEDLSLRNSKIKKGIASESLANIFLNQGKVKKAIKIYEQLLLKYPEKKSYFAGQIEKLQNLS